MVIAPLHRNGYAEGSKKRHTLMQKSASPLKHTYTELLTWFLLNKGNNFVCSNYAEQVAAGKDSLP